MVDLPVEAQQEFERMAAAKSSQGSFSPELLAELEGMKQRKMAKAQGSSLLDKLGSFITGTAGGILSAGAKTALGAASLLPETAGPGLFGEGINRLSKSGETPQQAMKADLQPIIDAFNKQYGSNPVAQGFSSAVEAIPYAAGPGEVELPEALAKLASKMPRGLQSLTKAATGTLKAAPINAGYGALSYNPDETTPEKALQGALVGTAIKGAFSGAEGLVKGVSNSGKQILDALKILKEEKVPVTASDVLGPDSILENFQKNFLTNFIGSGQSTKFKRAIKAVKGKAGGVLNKLLGGEDIDFVLDNVIDRIKGRFKDDSKKSGELYDLVEEHIDKNNIPYDDPLTRQVAKDELAKLNEGAAQEGPLLENTQLRQILTKLAHEPENLNALGDRKLSKEEATRMLTGEGALPKQGKKYKPSKFAKSKIYTLMQEEKDPYTRGVYNRLYKARKADLKNIAENSGDEKLKGLMGDADKFFKEDMAKYRHKSVKPFLYDIKTPQDAFRTFVKSSVTENPKFLENFTKLLDPTDKSRIAGYMLKDAINKEDGTIKAGRWQTIWDNIGNRTKDMLFNPEDRKEIDRISKLAKLSKTAREALETPNTGVTATRGGATLASAAMISNALKDIATGNFKGAVSWGLPFVAAPVAQEVINNPAFLKIIALLKDAQERGLMKNSGAGALTNQIVGQ